MTELFVYDNFSRSPVDHVAAGDICALTGLAAVSIGDTVCLPEALAPLPTITVGAAVARAPEENGAEGDVQAWQGFGFAWTLGFPGGMLVNDVTPLRGMLHPFLAFLHHARHGV